MLRWVRCLACGGALVESVRAAGGVDGDNHIVRVWLTLSLGFGKRH